MGTTCVGLAPQFNVASDLVAENLMTTSSPNSNTMNDRLASHNGPLLRPSIGVGFESLRMRLPNAKETKLVQEEFQDISWFVMGTDSSKAQSEIKMRKGRGHT